MGVVISPDSELGKELAKHEQHRTKYVPDELQPGNPYEFRPYPAMLYKAQARNGKHVCMDAAPHPHLFATDRQYERAILETEAFNTSCQRIVHSEREHSTAHGEGWRPTPHEAMAAHEALQQDIGNAAAEAAHRAQGMSAKAKAELKAADDSTHEHVVDVAGTPASVRGTSRQRKSRAVTKG